MSDLQEYEWQALPEYEDEFEFEANPKPSKTQRQVAVAAARAGLRALNTPGLNSAREFEDEFEFEDEYEFEDEFEDESNPQARALASQVLMEHLAQAAARTPNDAEAEAFIGALVPLAAQILPKVGSAILKNAPQLIRSVSNITNTLRQSPQTRKMIRTIPTALQRTANKLAHQQKQGHPITAQQAVRTLAKQTARVIANPNLAHKTHLQIQRANRRMLRSSACQREW
jgi:hypothetical protein